WQDRRTAERCRELSPHRGRIAALTGLVLDPYFSATKLEWLLQQGDLRERAERGQLLAGTMDSWLVWHLTGGAVHATDPTNASRTMLYDLERGEWSEALCDLFGVPMGILPEVRPSSGSFGVASAELLGSEIPIGGVAGDQQAALFGQAWLDEGDGTPTAGTGAFRLMHTGQRRPPAEAGLLVTAACDRKGGRAYAMEASIFIAGAAIQWLRDGLGIIGAASESDKIAREIESNEGVYFVPAPVGMGAHYWDPNARGMIVGLARGPGRAHLVRAGLEDRAYGTHDVVRVMRDRAGTERGFDYLRVDV